MNKICGSITGTPYARYSITTNMMTEFIRAKVRTIIEEQDLDLSDVEVHCFPQVMGDRRNGIKYACMAICMTGITEEDDSLYGKLKPFNVKPMINKSVMNSIVRSYEFNREKLRGFVEHPRLLRGMALSVKDVEFLLNKSQLHVQPIQGKAYYVFYADMDRILDEFLLPVDEQDPDMPNYKVLGIKAMGDKPDSPLTYDVMVNEAGGNQVDDDAEIFKALVSRNG